MTTTYDDWLDDPEPTAQPAPHRRRVAWYTAALAPWAVVVGLLITNGSDDATTPAPAGELHATTEATVPSSGDRATVVGGPSGAGTQADSAPTALEIRGDWRQAPGRDAAATAALMAGRDWLAGELDVATDLLAVEAVEQLDGRVAVVTLQARTTEGERMRFGATVRIDGEHARPTGQPWLLPEIPTDAGPLETMALSEPQFHLEAVEALQHAGYRDVELEALERTESWPVIAHVRARTPAGRAVTSPVVLRRHVDRFVVAGTGVGDVTQAAEHAWDRR
ncbi:MAG: hypothetical protein WD011_00025 [Nitriliruptoraceae bacterium]